MVPIGPVAWLTDANVPVLADRSTVACLLKSSATPGVPTSVASAIPVKTSVLPGAIWAPSGAVGRTTVAEARARAAAATRGRDDEGCIEGGRGVRPRATGLGPREEW